MFVPDDAQFHAEVVGQRLGHQPGAVFGPIVNDDHVESLGEARKHLVDMRQKPAKVFALIVRGHDQAQPSQTVVGV